jgi:hypothetical protein
MFHPRRLAVANTSTSAVLRHRARCSPRFTLDDVCSLLDGIDAEQRVRPRSAPVTLSRDTYAAIVRGYSLLWHALERAGLQLDRMPSAASEERVWVWFFCWDGGTRHGPFGTLDAAIDAAFAQIRSGGNTDVR